METYYLTKLNVNIYTISFALQYSYTFIASKLWNLQKTN